MFRWAFLLRVLLTLGLMLNGSAYAAATMDAMPAMHMGASAHMGTAPVDAVHPSARYGDDDEACHGAAAVSAAASADTERPECCPAGACLCVCAHHVSADVLGVGLRSSPFAHAPFVRTLAASYASPALPLPIRPPIG